MNIPSSCRLAAGAFLFATLFGCGGGGGGGGSSSAGSPPVANAGTDQTVSSGTAVTLSGSGSDSDGTVTGYQWVQTGGAPTLPMQNSGSAAASFTAPNVASSTQFIFRLTVTDNQGNTASDDVLITVRPRAYTGFDFALATGDYWRFGWDAYKSTYAMSDTSSGSAASEFQLTLGGPTTISGVTMYAVLASGNWNATVNGDPVTFKPRWLYLGMSDNRMLGSSDGTTLATIFDANTGYWAGGGFFVTLPATTLVTTQSASLNNDYVNEASAIKAGRSSSQSQCEYYGGITICGDSSFSYTQNEYFKRNVGPLGFYYYNAYSFSGGGFYSGGQDEYHLGLTASSLRGDSAASVLEVEPNNSLASAMVLTPPATVDGAALNEADYGGSTIVLNEVEPNDGFGAPQSLSFPAWIGGSVASGDAGTSVAIPASGGYAAYTATLEDIYTVTPSASGTLHARLAFPGTGADLDLYAFTSSGGVRTMVGRSIDDDSLPAADFVESVSFTATAGTIYYFAVDGYNVPSPATYELEIYLTTHAAALKVVDWFKVVLTSAKALQVGISGGPSVAVADAGGARIASASPATSGGSASLTTATLPTGTYYIGVTAGGSYRLTVD